MAILMSFDFLVEGSFDRRAKGELAWHGFFLKVGRVQKAFLVGGHLETELFIFDVMMENLVGTLLSVLKNEENMCDF